MVLRLTDQLSARLQEELPREPAGPGRMGRALLRAWLDRRLAHGDKARRMGTALLAAVTNNPDLLKPVRTLHAHWQQALRAGGLAPGQALIVMAILDGLFFWRLFELLDPTPANLCHIRAVLEQLVNARPDHPAT